MPQLGAVSSAQRYCPPPPHRPPPPALESNSKGCALASRALLLQDEIMGGGRSETRGSSLVSPGSCLSPLWAGSWPSPVCMAFLRAPSPPATLQSPCSPLGPPPPSAHLLKMAAQPAQAPLVPLAPELVQQVQQVQQAAPRRTGKAVVAPPPFHPQPPLLYTAMIGPRGRRAANRHAHRAAADWRWIIAEALLCAFLNALFLTLVTSGASSLMAASPWLIIAPAAASLLVAALTCAAAAVGYCRQGVHTCPMLLLAASMLHSCGASLLHQYVLRGAVLPAYRIMLNVLPFSITGRWRCQGCLLALSPFPLPPRWRLPWEAPGTSAPDNALPCFCAAFAYVILVIECWMGRRLPKWVTEWLLLPAVRMAIGAATLLFLFSFTPGGWEFDVISLVLGSVCAPILMRRAGAAGDLWETVLPLLPDDLATYLDGWSRDGLVAGGHAFNGAVLPRTCSPAA